MFSLIGTFPKSGIPNLSDKASPPPSPKILYLSPVSDSKYDIFSITPKRGMKLLFAISATLVATFCAINCGVVTTISSACGSNLLRAICISPVPGGRSIIR